MKALILVVAALLLASCQTTRYVGDENSPYYAVPAGTRAVLNQALAIPPEQVGVYMQNGKVLPWPEIDVYQAHCKFEVRDRKDVEQKVSPDEFIVIRVVRELTHMVNWGRWQVAGVSLSAGLGDGQGGLSVQTYATYLYLGSDRQPRVFRLGCGHWAVPGTLYAEHLSIAQIRKALGNVVTLQLPAKGG